MSARPQAGVLRRDLSLIRSGADFWTARLLRIAGRLRRGRLSLTTPQGETLLLCGSEPGPAATLLLHSPRAARRLLQGGGVAFAEAYRDGDWDSPDLVALLRLVTANEAVTAGPARGLAPLRAANRLWHRLHANTRRGSRRNIAFHYDLGNAFYRRWLDAGLTYSSALYEAPGQSLEAAQEAKYARIAELLRPEPGQRVLEIGCGWGGLAERLTREHGCEVTGLTLSREQLAHARARVPEADLRLQDYRDVRGTYDRIASIEMLEAVGEAHWPTYFRLLRERLAETGVAVLQVITIADERFERYRRGADFIQRHVFPGGMLPSPGVLRREIAAAGLRLTAEQRFGESYAETLAEWRRRFRAAWPEIAPLGFDEPFRRLWDYYLCYCEAGFRDGTIDVGLYRIEQAR